LIYAGTLDDYIYKRWDDEYNIWIDDLEKRAAILLTKRQEQEALAAAEEASRLAAIVPPTEEELAAIVAENLRIQKAMTANVIHSLLRQNLEKGTLYNGKNVATDSYSLILLNGAVTLANAGQWPVDGSFKLDGVLSPVTASDILGIFGAVQSHVIGCYAREKELLDALEVLTTIEDVTDFSVNW
jgi:hypothetical protein